MDKSDIPRRSSNIGAAINNVLETSNPLLHRLNSRGEEPLHHALTQGRRTNTHESLALTQANLRIVQAN